MPRAKQPDQAEVTKTAPAEHEQVNGSVTPHSDDASAKKAAAAKSAGATANQDVAAKEETKPDKGRAPTTASLATPAATGDKAKAARPLRAKTGGGPDHAAAIKVEEPDEGRELFLAHQRELLFAERNNYTRQAEELRAQAEALALEHEPGDVQFDEEGGEGGTSNVDRELDLHLSAQAHAAVEEIDAAMVKIGVGTYGYCESCGTAIPKARLEALPHARLCVSCKSGGLTARRQ